MLDINALLAVIGFILTMGNVVGEQRLRDWEVNIRATIGKFSGAKFRANVMKKLQEDDDNKILGLILFLFFYVAICQFDELYRLVLFGIVIWAMAYAGIIDIIRNKIFGHSFRGLAR